MSFWSSGKATPTLKTHGSLLATSHRTLCISATDSGTFGGELCCFILCPASMWHESNCMVSKLVRFLRTRTERRKTASSRQSRTQDADAGNTSSNSNSGQLFDWSLKLIKFCSGIDGMATCPLCPWFNSDESGMKHHAATGE